ncbi:MULTISPECIES: HugZ family protein [Acidithiobacillus]|uniref:Pyridoxamine 5'-phosphate oxidase n=2 Tax=Acidithiobacillus TaxID=119977 RepID=A0A179B8P5_ACIFR|nr:MULTISPECIES: pyridoxamine 5'-phosphate oxidase family protein [Acidithiobacillus]MDA8182513.1 pyridoxamine 5'-phosphate oxidase family protein [Acidithiobacillus sp.]MBU2854484.1 pyridoxamine 5'-phosphate oxidase [Acidithiobacillus ferriphilus]MEB8486656.1 pyridoxamine 5'-phosphate oxidase family protein [Acidithiobacillus ferriphilus]MEB8490631.1 pyridoxamine 5'-phosphate oxidase family protein [Acidithiobacillus ferriphilus]MEB8493309.1 pyridoxamine 5'-phosphate oxidase family protein [A
MMERTEAVAVEISNLIVNTQTMTLATLNSAGAPEVSMAPFIYETTSHQFYTVVSMLSPHTAHLAAKKPTGIMIIEDEQSAPQVLGRRRVSYTCDVHEISRGSENYHLLYEQFMIKFGGIMEVLFELPDFHAFCLRPISGRYIAGFGKAYTLKGDVIAPIGPDDIQKTVGS